MAYRGVIRSSGGTGGAPRVVLPLRNGGSTGGAPRVVLPIGGGGTTGGANGVVLPAVQPAQQTLPADQPYKTSGNGLENFPN